LHTPSQPPTATNDSSTSETPIDIDGETTTKSDRQSALPPSQEQQQPNAAIPPPNEETHPEQECPVDVCFEASKLPLDLAIFNSTRVTGDEKMRKYLQAVLVIGGTALTQGMAHALESRLQAIATPAVQNMEKVQIIPPPKEVDPCVLAWKGAAVLGKMDGVADLWLTQADWDTLGMRGLKERCFYL